LGEICYLNIIVENFVLPPNIKVIVNYNTFQNFWLSPPPPTPPNIFAVTLAPLQKDMASICLCKWRLGKEGYISPQILSLPRCSGWIGLQIYWWPMQNLLIGKLISTMHVCISKAYILHYPWGSKIYFLKYYRI
jgi:hypothetical protein